MDSCKPKTDVNSGQPIKLLFNFEEGGAYQYIIKSDIEIKPQISEKDITINQDMTIACNYRKLETQGTSNSMETTYDRIIISSGIAPNIIEFDTDNDDGKGLLFQSIRDVIDRPFKMLISPYGNILSSTGVSEGEDKHFSDTAFQKIMLQALQVYPKKVIKPGDIWERHYNTSIGFIHVTVASNYKLMFISNGNAHIEFTSRMQSPKGNSEKMDLTGIQRGVMDVDIKTGLVSNAKIEQQLSGHLYMNNRETPVNIEANTHIMGTKK